MSNKDKEKKGKDNRFKNNFSIEGFVKLERKDFINDNAEIKIMEHYKPDLILENDNYLIICESSSTSDRKSHIGELTQFFSLVAQSGKYKKFSLLLFLDGEAKYPPTVWGEYGRLESYCVSGVFSEKNKNKIEKILLLDAKEFKDEKNVYKKYKYKYEDIENAIEREKEKKRPKVKLLKFPKNH